MEQNKQITSISLGEETKVKGRNLKKEETKHHCPVS